MQSTVVRAPGSVALALSLLVAGCGGAPVTPSPSPSPAARPPASPFAVASESAATLEAPDAVPAGVDLLVSWTGPNGPDDYVTIVKAGTTAWTNEDYFYTTEGSPGRLVVPSVDGPYELWYILGADKTVLARRALTVTPFEGSLSGPAEVAANTPFQVDWTGPNGRGDFVTIVKAGSTAWTDEDYFYTTEGSPGTLLAPLEQGAYELWYVIGSDASVKARSPITVTAATPT